MAGEAATTLCGAIVCVIVVLAVWSFDNLAPTQMALRYNSVLKTVSPSVQDSPGIYLLFPWGQLLKYDKTIRTIEYTQSHRDILDGRTKDGLPLILGVAFQYRLLPDELYMLYHEFENNEGGYLPLFKLVGIHLITEQATRFTAYQFFNEKQKIAQEMKMVLDAYFRKHLHATVESLQINEDDLPEEFTQTILTAATSKQNITKMGKTLEAKKIEYQTAVLVAEAQANVTIQQAIGEKHRILQNGHADAAIIEAYVEAEIGAYKKVHEEMNLQGDDLINYIWYDTLAGGGVSSDKKQKLDSTMLVGVSPSAYISEYKGP